MKNYMALVADSVKHAGVNKDLRTAGAGFGKRKGAGRSTGAPSLSCQASVAPRGASGVGYGMLLASSLQWPGPINPSLYDPKRPPH